MRQIQDQVDQCEDEHGVDDILAELDRNPWQLYQSRGAGAVRFATEELDAALEKAKEAVRGGMDMYDAMNKIVNPIRDKHADLGASDTEGRVYAELVLEKASPKKPWPGW